jgi:hypothetical protein
MSLVIVSTTRRHTQPHEASGYVYLIDPSAHRVIQRSTMIEHPYRAMETNPRGGMRGCKGISVLPERIAIANSSAVFQYDPAWNLLSVFSHPSCSAIHDIAYQGDTLWVTSSRTDLLMQLDLTGKLLKHYYLRGPSPALERLGWKPPLLLSNEQILQGAIDFRNPKTHDEFTFDRAHVNSVCFLSSGEVLVSLGQIVNVELAASLRLKVLLIRLGLWSSVLSINRRLSAAFKLKKDLHSDLVVRPAKATSVVLRISPQGAYELCLDIPGVSTPSHSLLSLPDDSVLYLNTHLGEVVHFDPRNGEMYSSTKATDGFLRGISALEEKTFLMGSKGELITFDIETHLVLDRFTFSDDPKESVYDIKALPAHYAPPPASFEEHFLQATNQPSGEFLRQAGEISLQLKPQPVG